MIAGNGIPIYYYPNKHLHSFCICLYFQAGSMYESGGQNGSTHLWEHMVFRNLNRIYSGEFFKHLERFGLSFSACTYKEFVYFQITGAVKHFTHAANIISLVFEPIRLPSAEIILEKKRIKAEMRENEEELSLDYFAQRLVWENTSLAHTICGKNSVIDKIGVRALQNIHNRICSQGNVFFYVTGCFSQKDIEGLNTAVAPYLLSAGARHNNQAPLAQAFFQRDGRLEIKNNSCHTVRFSFDIDTARYTYAELDLLYDLLCGGDNAILFQELSERTGYVYSFDSSLERYNNLGCLYFSFELQKKNILPAMEKVVASLNRLKTDLDGALSYVLPFYMDNAELALDDAEGLNWNMAYECHIMPNNYRSVAEKKQEYERVTAERIMQIAEEIFVRDHMLVALQTNKKTFPLEKAKDILQTL